MAGSSDDDDDDDDDDPEEGSSDKVGFRGLCNYDYVHPTRVPALMMQISCFQALMLCC